MVTKRGLLLVRKKKEPSILFLFLWLFGCTIAQLFWFLAVNEGQFPHPDVGPQNFYIAFFLISGMPFLAAMIKEDKKWFEAAFLFYGLGGGITYAIGQTIPLFRTYALASMPGFVGGIIYAGIYKYIRDYFLIRQKRLAYNTISEDLQDPVRRFFYISMFLLFFDLLLYTLYFSILDFAPLLWVAFALTIVVVAFSLRVGKLSKLYKNMGF